MTKEALKLALEAFDDRTSLMKWQIARDAVREALAQPEERYTYGTPLLDSMTKDYIPPQRTWVGLTKEERHEISMANRPYCADIMAAHEEELKRRNT